MTNGNVIKELRQQLEELSKEKSPEEMLRDLIKANRLMLALFSESFIDDHRKIERMWPVYWALVVMSGPLAISLVTLIWALLTHQMELVVVK